MSIIVSVKINDGIVMAADSASTFAVPGAPPHIYEHANKIVNVVKGLPIGVMTCGMGGIGDASIATLLKDLRRRLTGNEPFHRAWALDPTNFTMERIATHIRDFIAEKIAQAPVQGTLILRACGYSTHSRLPEQWLIMVDNGSILPTQRVQSETDIGLYWSGENEALSRLVLGIGNSFTEAAVSVFGSTLGPQVAAGLPKLRNHLEESLMLPAAPIQDAIDLARFMVETTKGYIRFAVKRAKTVGGPVEIATITKHEGFKWIQRKHFYSHEVNG